MSRPNQIERDAHRLYDSIINVVSYGGMFGPEVISRTLEWLEYAIVDVREPLEAQVLEAIKQYLLETKREIEG